MLTHDAYSTSGDAIDQCMEELKLWRKAGASPRRLLETLGEFVARTSVDLKLFRVKHATTVPVTRIWKNWPPGPGASIL
jgi:hypothetical protein